MEFRLLGPLEVRTDVGVVPVGGAKQRALLALLLLHANEVVSRDRLIDELWGDRAPGTADRSLDHQVSRLRKSLDPDLIVTRAGGYALEVEPESIDAWRFERLLAEGRAANAAGRPTEAARLLRDALELWHGAALADLAYESFARTEIERLGELRLAALEEWMDANLALGHHRSVVAELETLVSKHPLRERFRGQLMLALYRSGQQADALRVYGDTRLLLAEELGLEPGPALRELEQAILRHDPSLDLASPARVEDGDEDSRGRRKAVAAATVGVAAAAAATVVVLVHGGVGNSGAQPVAEPDSVALVAAKTGEVVGQARAVPSPALALFGEGALWSVSFTGELSKIDPDSGEVVKRLNTGVPVPCGLATGAGSVWVTDCTSPTLVRIDPAQAVVAEPIGLPTDRDSALVAQATGEVAVGAGSVWVARGFANPSWVERLDPKTGHIQRRILIPEGGAQRLAFGDGALWVGGDVDAPGVPKLWKIDPRTNQVTPALANFGNAFCCVVAGGGFVWGATTPDRTVWKLGEDGTIVAPIKLPSAAESLTYAEGAVWAADGEAGTVVRIDPTTNATKTYTLGHDLRTVAVRKGVIAVGVQPSGRDVTAGLTGRVVHVALGSNYLDWSSTDPAAAQTAFNPYQSQFHYATCAKLFNYPDASGAAGKELVPEVAAGWPAVTDRGRTYTFRIRRGFRFSPPSGAPVTAESFRHAIERFLSPRMQPGPWSLAVLPDVVGATAFHAGTTAHLAGVAVQNGRLVIHLVKPAPDLVTRLARPGFCAVPADLPTVLLGVPYPIPTAGPYYLAARSANVVVLKPNPNYSGPRPHRLDAIVYEMNMDVGEAITRLGQGTIDYVQEVDPALAPGTAVARAAGRRYRLTPDKWTEGLVLNTHRALFADAGLRRSVAYALDRRTLAADMGGVIAVPTSHVLASNLRYVDDLPAFSLTSDLRRARQLAGGGHRHAVFAVHANANGEIYNPALVERVRDQLGAIGVEVSLLPLRQSSSDPPADWSRLLARADIAQVERNAAQSTDAVEYLRLLPPYLPRADAARLKQIATWPRTSRGAAGVALAKKLERDGVYLAYADLTHPELVSRRLGCVIDQPEYPGIDLAALCLPRARG